MGTIMARGNDGSGWSMSVWPRRRNTEGQDKDVIRVLPHGRQKKPIKVTARPPKRSKKKKQSKPAHVLSAAEREGRAAAIQARAGARMAKVSIDRIVRDAAGAAHKIAHVKKSCR
jgi:hypothetical protein